MEALRRPRAPDHEHAVRLLPILPERPALLRCAQDDRGGERAPSRILRYGWPRAAVPKVLALSPDGRFAAVSHPDAKLVSIVDLERRVVARTIALPSTPDGVAYAAGDLARP